LILGIKKMLHYRQGYAYGENAIVIDFPQGLSSALSNLATLGSYSAERHYQREKISFYGRAFDDLIRESKELHPPEQSIHDFFLSKFTSPDGPTEGISAKKFGGRPSYLKLLSQPGLFGERKYDSQGRKYINQATRVKLLQRIDKRWLKHKVGIMQNVLRAKFMLPPFKEILLSTHDYPIYVHNRGGANIWNKSPCKLRRRTIGDREVTKWGLLGDLLMEIREQLEIEQRKRHRNSLYISEIFLVLAVKKQN